MNVYQQGEKEQLAGQQQYSNKSDLYIERTFSSVMACSKNRI
jgi:hypothetical protein